MEVKKSSLWKWISAFVVLIIIAVFGSELVETVDAKEYHVKQAAITGSMTVHGEPGTYGQMFGRIKKYPRTLTFYFSKDELDGGTGSESRALQATFMGNSTADVSGMIMVELPTDDSSRIALHRKYGSIESINMNLVRNAIAGALKQTGPMFRPEEAFTVRRPEFTSLMRSILTEGIFMTETVQDTIREQGKEIILDRSILKLDKQGKKILSNESPLKKYNIIIGDFVIKNFDFDQETDRLIKAKKIAQQKIVTARADAQKAKQDALTAIEQGKARVAQAEADALVEKKTAVVNAEREAEVARQTKLEAIERAAAKLAMASAEAKANKLKVQAGLTPQERAQFEKETKIGVAQALSKWVGPKVVVGSGGGKNGGSTMMDALAIDKMMNIADRMDK